jgi:rare lipoprotein A
MKNSIIIFSTGVLLFISSGFSSGSTATTPKPIEVAATVVADSTETKAEIAKPAEANNLTLYKKSALATYYADKFNGRKTTSGERFHNSKYTAAHMKLPLGTIVRVTNETNGKFVDVKVNDRGPYSKKLEIDLTKTAYMEIASKKSSGSFKVKLEILGK